MQNLASRGLGATPTGFAADQERQAYQNQATTQGNDYATALQGQNTEALNNYNNAVGMLNGSTNSAQSAALTAQGTADSSDSSLYGTAEQQVASPWATALGGLAGAAGAGASIYKTASGGK
jgi:hypothetical protein